MNLFNFDEIQTYWYKHQFIAVVLIGVLLFILGWIISRLLRPSYKDVQKELQSIKKELLDELNTAKKFNSDYQLLVKKEEREDA